MALEWHGTKGMASLYRCSSTQPRLYSGPAQFRHGFTGMALYTQGPTGMALVSRKALQACLSTCGSVFHTHLTLPTTSIVYVA